MRQRWWIEESKQLMPRPHGCEVRDCGNISRMRVSLHVRDDKSKYGHGRIDKMHFVCKKHVDYARGVLESAFKEGRLL